MHCDACCVCARGLTRVPRPTELPARARPPDVSGRRIYWQHLHAMPCTLRRRGGAGQAQRARSKHRPQAMAKPPTEISAGCRRLGCRLAAFAADTLPHQECSDNAAPNGNLCRFAAALTTSARTDQALACGADGLYGLMPPPRSESELEAKLSELHPEKLKRQLAPHVRQALLADRRHPCSGRVALLLSGGARTMAEPTAIAEAQGFVRSLREIASEVHLFAYLDLADAATSFGQNLAASWGAELMTKGRPPAANAKRFRRPNRAHVERALASYGATSFELQQHSYASELFPDWPGACRSIRSRLAAISRVL